jgi:DNA-binding response OmpR family regulator
MKYSILIVEDELNTLKVLSTALKKEKFSVTSLRISRQRKLGFRS